MNCLAKVSIVLPVYNGAKYLRKSIESCLVQDNVDLELVIVNDGSIDETENIVNSFIDTRIVYLKHEKNKGLPYALNTGFKKARGEYLSWTSADNYYQRDALRKMISFLEDNKCDFVYSDYWFFYSDCLEKIDKVLLADIDCLKSENMIGPCFLFKRQVMEEIGEYDPDTVFAEDYDYWIRVSKKFSMRHLNKPLYYYRKHEQSLYVSQYYRVKVADFLVRLKNDIADISQIEDLFIDLIALMKTERLLSGKMPILKKIITRINKIFISRTYHEKIRTVLIAFKAKEISFMQAREKLEKIIN